MQTIILIVVLAPLAAAALALALITPHLMRMSGNMEKAAFDLWEEPAAPEGDTKTG